MPESMDGAAAALSLTWAFAPTQLLDIVYLLEVDGGRHRLPIDVRGVGGTVRVQRGARLELGMPGELTGREQHFEAAIDMVQLAMPVRQRLGSEQCRYLVDQLPLRHGFVLPFDPLRLL